MNIEEAKYLSENTIIPTHAFRRFVERVYDEEGKIHISPNDQRDMIEYIRLYLFQVFRNGITQNAIKESNRKLWLKLKVVVEKDSFDEERCFLIYRNRLFIFSKNYGTFITVLHVHKQFYVEFRHMERVKARNLNNANRRAKRR